MQISTSSWHYEIFDWWYRQKNDGMSFAAHQERRRFVGYNEETYNLCPYVRAVVFWGPLRFMFLPPRLKYTLTALFALLQLHGGLLKGWKFFQVELIILVSVLIAGAIIGGCIGVVWLGAFLRQKYREYKNNHPTQQDSFFAVLKEYMSAAHEGICPPITFTKE